MADETLTLEREQTPPPASGKAIDNRRHAPDYIKPYPWAAKTVGTPDYKRAVELVLADLNGDKEKPNFSYEAVDTAIRRLKADLDDVSAEQAAADAAKAQREQNKSDLEAMKQKYS